MQGATPSVLGLRALATPRTDEDLWRLGFGSVLGDRPARPPQLAPVAGTAGLTQASARFVLRSGRGRSLLDPRWLVSSGVPDRIRVWRRTWLLGSISGLFWRRGLELLRGRRIPRRVATNGPRSACTRRTGAGRRRRGGSRWRCSQWHRTWDTAPASRPLSWISSLWLPLHDAPGAAVLHVGHTESEACSATSTASSLRSRPM